MAVLGCEMESLEFVKRVFVVGTLFICHVRLPVLIQLRNNDDDNDKITVHISIIRNGKRYESTYSHDSIDLRTIANQDIWKRPRLHRKNNS